MNAFSFAKFLKYITYRKKVYATYIYCLQSNKYNHQFIATQGKWNSQWSLGLTPCGGTAFHCTLSSSTLTPLRILLLLSSWLFHLQVYPCCGLNVAVLPEMEIIWCLALVLGELQKEMNSHIIIPAVFGGLSSYKKKR